jgi:hypothetical protein
MCRVGVGLRKAQAGVKPTEIPDATRRSSVESEIETHVDDSRDVLGPFEITTDPVEGVGDS